MNSIKSLQELLLPGEDGKLHPSSDLVIRDNEYHATRISNSVYLSGFK